MRPHEYVVGAFLGALLLFASGFTHAEELTRADVDAWIERTRDAEPAFPDDALLRGEELAKLEPFLMPLYMRELAFPEAEIQITPTGDYTPHEAYERASLAFGDQTSLGEDGRLLDYVAGRPFSVERIEAAPPDEAGLMIAWNFDRRWQRYGHWAKEAVTFLLNRDGGHDASQFPDGMLDGGAGIVRHIESSWYRAYLSHLATEPETDYRLDIRMAEGAHWKDFIEYSYPFEFRGQKLLVERALDPEENDTLNAYLPSERKVRRLSAKERTDSWIGSELTFDDFYGFDGRVLDYNWRYLGHKKIVAVVNSMHPYARFHGPHSVTIRDRWEVRDTMILEQTSKYDYHPYASKILFMDPQTFHAIGGLMFDRDNRLLKIFVPVYAWSESTPDNPELSRGGRVPIYKSYSFINVQTGNATITNIIQSVYPERTASEIRRLFRVDNLTEGR